MIHNGYHTIVLLGYKRSRRPEVDDSVDVEGSWCAFYVHHLDSVDMLTLSGWFVVDAFVGFDVFGEIGDQPLFGPCCVGLLID